MKPLKQIIPDLDTNLKITTAIVISSALGLLIYLSVLNLAGSFGSVVGEFLRTMFGRGVFIVPIGFFVASLLLYRLQQNKEWSTYWNSRIIWGLVLAFLSIEGFFNIIMGVNTLSEIRNGGGLVGYMIYPNILGPLGVIGASLVLIANLVISFFFLSKLTMHDFIERCKKIINEPGLLIDLIPDIFSIIQSSGLKGDNEAVTNDKPVIIPKETVDIRVKKKKNKIAFSLFSDDDGTGVTELKPASADIQWKLPQFDILKQTHSLVEPGDVEGNKATIKETLSHFGIDVDMGDTRVGPTVTQYTLKPANGVKLSTIDNLQRDIALALAAQHIRIEAPIPGQSLVGIEIPNKSKSTVRLRDIIQTNSFVNFSNDLAVAVGQDVTGKNIIYSLSKMPHLLVAGATGSGKSIFINGLLMSLLFRYSPQELQIVLVDMKRVELKLYDGVPHLITPVITEAEKAINALKWTVLEMDKRYKILEEHGKRNIADFNTYAKSNSIDDLPFVVFIIDELGDLMMLAKAEVEPIIVRLTQMSRAVGIHLVLGTQRPDTHVVTGLIKANVPTRIAFAVASQIDSRVILDQGGAEKLLGQGDGLFVSPSNMHPIRFQGSLVEESEVKICVKFLKEQGMEKGWSNIRHEVTDVPKSKVHVPGMSSVSSSDGDTVFEEARNLVIQYQKASASFLQQMMGIGYPKAARIIQQLEEIGVVGPQNGSKPREVYVLDDEQ